MLSDTLTVTVINLNGEPNSAVAGLLKGFPSLRLLSQVSDPQEILSQDQEHCPDLVIVELANGYLPEWLEDLTRSLPNTAIMLCSENQERDFLIRSMQLGVREFISLPINWADLEKALDRAQAAKRKRLYASEGRTGQMVAVSGLKGGVGTTTVAVNLATALAEKWPNRVVLVDLGRPFPDVGKFLDLGKRGNLIDLVTNVDHLDPKFITKTLQTHKSTVSVLPGYADINELGLIDPHVVEKVWAALRYLFDWIVVDLSLWLDDLYFQVAQKADQVLLLTELTIPELKNLKQLRKLFQQIGVEKERLKIVVNRYQKSSGVDLHEVETLQSHRVFFTMPSDYPALVESINHGVPLKEMSPRSKLTRSFGLLAMELAKTAPLPERKDATRQQNARRRFLFF